MALLKKRDYLASHLILVGTTGYFAQKVGSLIYMGYGRFFPIISRQFFYHLTLYILKY
jgi:hypothetical protein